MKELMPILFLIIALAMLIMFLIYKKPLKGFLFRFAQAKSLAWIKNVFMVGLKEKRAFERIPIRLSLRFRDFSSNKWGLVQTQDISPQGVCFLADEELPLRSLLEIWLPVPNKGESLYTKGETVWSEKFGFAKYRVGVKLERADLRELSQALKVA